MTDDRTKRAVALALERLLTRVREPRALAPSADDRALLEAAIERARGQWLGPTEPVLTVALAGGTGVGKSTLVNALADSVIAEASEIRPTTRHIQVYHHRDDTLGNLTEEAVSEATFVAHDRPELRHKMLVDSPDLDSFVTRHRATTKALLKRAGLVLYVFSPERYLEERTWSVLRQETEFSACAAVLNKSDRLGSPEELEQITDDLREHFAGIGLSDIRIFRVCARAHVPDSQGVRPRTTAPVDEMVALRAYIERELQGSEIAKLLRAQREVVVNHLRAEVDRVAPEAAAKRLDRIASDIDGRADDAAGRLAGEINEQLIAVEAELSPLMTLRRHDEFWGPFRTWLALSDFVGIGLTSLLRRHLGRKPADPAGAIERILTQGGTAAQDLLRGEAHAIQDLLFRSGLPIGRWREITAGAEAPRLIAEIAGEIERDFELTATKISHRGRSLVKTVSTLGGFVPSALVLVGLVVMTRDLLVGNYLGLPLLWHLLAMMILFFLALQGLVAALSPGGTRWLGASLGPQAVRRVLRRTLGGWVTTYRTDLEADIADFREPIAVLEAAMSETTKPMSVASTPANTPDSLTGQTGAGDDRRQPPMAGTVEAGYR